MRNKPDVAATTAKHPDSRSQISRYGDATAILVPRGRAPFGQHQESRPLATQRWRFLVLTKRSAASGDENALRQSRTSSLRFRPLVKGNEDPGYEGGATAGCNRRTCAVSTPGQRERRPWVRGWRYGWMQPAYMRSVSFLGKFTSGSRISASRSDLLKLANIYPLTSLKRMLYLDALPNYESNDV